MAAIIKHLQTNALRSVHREALQQTWPTHVPKMRLAFAACHLRPPHSAQNKTDPNVECQQIRAPAADLPESTIMVFRYSCIFDRSSEGGPPTTRIKFVIGYKQLFPAHDTRELSCVQTGMNTGRSGLREPIRKKRTT
jgi:hypothetical protein